jgi:hypothetical protein
MVAHMGDELAADFELPVILRIPADVAKRLAAAQTLTPVTDARSHYFKRSTAPAGAGGRVWDRAVAELAKQGKVFKPGKECLIRCDDYFRWIEAHPIKRLEGAVAEADDAPIPFDRARARGGRFR